MNTSGILVAGIGSIFLGDDGFGPEVIEHTSKSLAGPRVRVTDYGTRSMHLVYDLLDGCEVLVLVDALPNRGSPGSLHIFEADHETLTAGVGLDAHAMNPAAAFASLIALGGTPPCTIVIGCEVDNVDEGIGLSDPVAAAVRDAEKAIEDVTARLLIPAGG